ncbi:MAG TPA: hypothetical protein PKW35_04050 [Nannocystaceae bacterium]|nr:hypothetical protein [Nannocystaceae bacterium]
MTLTDPSAVQAAAAPKFAHVDVQATILDSDTWATITGTPELGGKAHAEFHLFMLDVMAYTERVEVKRRSDGALRLVRYGCGIRILLAVEHLGGRIAVTLDGIGAKAQVAGADKHLEVLTAGLFGKELGGIVTALQSPDGLDDIPGQLDKAMDLLADLLADPAKRDKLVPQEVESPLIGAPVPTALNMARTHRMAMEGIYKGRAYAEQLQRCLDDSGTRKALIPAVLSEVYETFGVKGEPNADEKALVHEIFFKNRQWNWE